MRWIEKIKVAFRRKEYVFKGPYAEEAEILNEVGATVSFNLGSIGGLSLAIIATGLMLAIGSYYGIQIPSNVLFKFGIGLTLIGVLIYYRQRQSFTKLQEMGDVMVKIGQAEEGEIEKNEMERDGRE